MVRAEADPSVYAKVNGWSLAAAGYALVTLGLIVDLPTIGASGTWAAISIAVAALIAIGIVVAAAGMLQLRHQVDRDEIGVRRDLDMQALGPIILLAGVLALQVPPSLPVLLVSAVLVGTAAGLAIGGSLLLRGRYSESGSPSTSLVAYLVLGTTLVFVGVGVVLASQIGSFFVLSDVSSTVANDIGVAVCAAGCVVATYSAYAMRGPTRPVGTQPKIVYARSAGG